MELNKLSDTKALVKIIAFWASGGDNGKMDELVKWAYNDDGMIPTKIQHNSNLTAQEKIEPSFTDKYLATDGKPVFATQKRAFIRKFITGNEEVPINEVKAQTRKMSYSAFLDTVYWKSIAYYVKERDGKQCVLCGAEKRLVVHHKSYEHHGDELHHLDDLVCVCRKCHGEIHEQDVKVKNKRK